MANEETTKAVFQVDLKDNVTPALDNIDKGLNKIAANTAFNRMEQKVNETGRAAGELAHSNSKGLAGIIAVGTMVGNVMATMFTKAIEQLQMLQGQVGAYIQGGIDLARNAEMQKSVLAALGAQQGYTAKQMENFVAKLEKTGITTRSAQQSLQLMTQSQLDLAQSTELAEIAQNKARVSNKSSSEVFEHMLYAITKLDTQMLVTDGIMVSNQKATDAYAKKLGRASAETLTFKERQQAMIEAIKEEAKSTAGAYKAASDTIGGALLSFPRYKEQLQLNIGRVFQPAADIFTKAKISSFKEMSKFMEDNKEELDRLGVSFEKVAKAVVDVITSLTENMPEINMKDIADQAERIAEGLVGAVYQVAALGEQLENAAEWWDKFGKDSGMGEIIKNMLSPINGVISALDKISKTLIASGGWMAELGKGAANLEEVLKNPLLILEKMSEAMRTLNQIAGFVAAGFKGLVAGLVPIVEGLVSLLKSSAALATGDLVAAFGHAEEAAKKMAKGFDLEAAQKAARDSILETAEAIANADKKTSDALKEAADSAKDLGDELGKIPPKLDEVNQQQEELNKALVQMKVRLARQLRDQDIAEQRAAIDRMIAESRRREDIARSTARAMANIYEQEAEAKKSALKDAAKAEKEFEKNATKEKAQMAKDYQRARIDLEKNFQRQLADIRNNFLISAREAQLKNDAIAYLQAKRQMQDQVREAEKNRNQQNTDQESDFNERKKALEDNLKEQRAAMKQALKDQLQTIEDNTAKQIEAFNKGLKQQEEDYQLSLKRQEEDRQLAMTRQKEDLKRSLQDQLDDLKAKYGEMVTTTADSLLEEAEEYQKTFGEGGSADMTMEEFFTRQQERLTQLNAIKEEMGATPTTNSVSSPHEALAAANAARSGGAANARPPSTMSPSVAHSMGIGQAGLIDFGAIYGRSSRDKLPMPASIPQPTSQSSGEGGYTSKSQQTVNFNFSGLAPYMERIAIRAATEVYRNMLASSKPKSNSVLGANG